MRAKVLTMALATITLAACDAGQQGTTTTPTSSNSGWNVQRQTSKMDGDVVVATKEISDTQTVFKLIVKCAANQLTISVESYHHGWTEHQGNPFVFDIDTNLWGSVIRTPLGRAKFGQGEPQPLSSLFVLSDYNNVLNFRGDAVLDNFNSINGTAVRHGEKFNAVAALKTMLPLVLDVRNETGSHELSIDRVGPVNQVFDACGGNEVVRVQSAKQPDPLPEPVAEPPPPPVYQPPPPPVEQAPPEPTEPEIEEPAGEPGEITPPYPITNPMPQYPPAAQRAGIEGSVTVQIVVDEFGKVSDAKIFRSSRNRDLDRAALQGVRTWRYRPAEQDGKPVKSVLNATIDFHF